jgi:predicted ArsR family transcriptional regulator
MAALNPLSRSLMALADRPAGVFVTEAAREVGVSRSHAGGRLRELERQGLVHATLVSGGRLRYRLSDRGERVFHATVG